MKAEFIAGPRGDLFTLYLPPDCAAPDRGDLIFIPPFAEEMNRSRALSVILLRYARRSTAGRTSVGSEPTLWLLPYSAATLFEAIS